MFHFSYQALSMKREYKKRVERIRMDFLKGFIYIRVCPCVQGWENNRQKGPMNTQSVKEEEIPSESFNHNAVKLFLLSDISCRFCWKHQHVSSYCLEDIHFHSCSSFIRHDGQRNRKSKKHSPLNRWLLEKISPLEKKSQMQPSEWKRKSIQQRWLGRRHERGRMFQYATPITADN